MCLISHASPPWDDKADPETIRPNSGTIRYADVDLCREDGAAGDGNSSAAADDPRFGGKLHVQGLAAKPALASPQRAPPQMPHVQDTSAG